MLPPDERVKSRAYMYSALNAGFTIGALLGGIALAFDSNDVLHALPWFTAAVFVVNATAITRLPKASHDQRTAEECGDITALAETLGIGRSYIRRRLEEHGIVPPIDRVAA